MTEVALRVMLTDVVVEVGGSGADELAARVRTAWSRCLLPDADPAGIATRVPVSLEQGADPTAVMDGLSPAITMAAITAQAGQVLMLHACGLADPATGRTVALVGPSGTGKTTAAAALGHRFGYVTDETVAVLDDLTIAPYPKPLSLRGDDGWHKAQRAVDDLVPPPERVHLHRVVRLSRDDTVGTDEPWLEQVDLLPAMASLAEETSFLSRMDRPLHRLADVLGATGGLQVLHYGDSSDLTGVVTSLLAER